VKGKLSENARLACSDQVNRGLRRSALLGIPAAMLLALILGSSVPAPRRVIFVLLVSAADIVTFFGAHRYLSRRKQGDVMRRYWFGPFSMALTGLAWASLAVFALPDAQEHADLRAVYLLFIVGVSATNVVGAAARRLYYFTSQVPMLGVVGIAFIASSDRVTHLLGFAVPIYFIVMTSLHHEVHTVVVSELQLQEQNDEANAQLRDANAQLSRQALCDDLTGLANRPAFMARLDAAVAAARRDHRAIGVLYLDIDRFKVINDSLGHAVGDMVLVEAARRIMGIIRGPDVLARLGGDEFTMLLDGVHGSREAIAIAQRVAAVLAEPFAVAGRRFNVSASIGIATNLDAADDGEALLSHADAAQYRAKQGGRNRIEVFDIELRESIQRRLGDEQELRDALTRGDILAWYQPEVELRSGQVVGAEALARWRHAERGILDASKFVPLAEEAGLVFRLDDRSVAGAVEARAGLARAGIDPRFRIWCNVSSGQLTRERPTERLSALLSTVGCDPSQIGIEITETAILPDVKAAAREIAAARDLGIKVALDDFGTGHSSLTLLRSLPIDRVKIDQTFVRELTRDANDAAIVRSVITLANDLGLEVVAEGVETIEQADVLARLGCQYAQGYLWARALPIDELTDRLMGQLHGEQPDAPTPPIADHRTGTAAIVAR
jgi:diguanylate cyclase (GGDEF)-like protein